MGILFLRVSIEESCDTKWFLVINIVNQFGKIRNLISTHEYDNINSVKTKYSI